MQVTLSPKKILQSRENIAERIENNFSSLQKLKVKHSHLSMGLCNLSLLRHTLSKSKSNQFNTIRTIRKMQLERRDAIF